jgi:hypothetical protein
MEEQKIWLSSWNFRDEMEVPVGVHLRAKAGLLCASLVGYVREFVLQQFLRNILNGLLFRFIIISPCMFFAANPSPEMKYYF